jgi:D-glycerate 3-kinase
MSQKLQLCEEFVIQNWHIHVSKHASAPRPPFFLGINGLQGSGKTTLVRGQSDKR